MNIDCKVDKPKENQLSENLKSKIKIRKCIGTSQTVDNKFLNSYKKSSF